MSAKIVKELMVPLELYTQVPQDATLREALHVLHQVRNQTSVDRHRPRSLLVVDSYERVIGKLEYLDILRALEPKYNLMGDLGTLSRAGVSEQVVLSLMDYMKLWEGSLDDICHRAAGLSVAELMQPLSQSIPHDAPLIEAIHRLLLSQSMRILVTENNTVTGVLRLADVIADISDRIESEPE